MIKLLNKGKAKAKAKPVDDEPARGRGRPATEKLNIDVDWLKARMAARGMKSWAELSRSLGIDKAMMSKSLTGDRVFAVKDVVKLAEALAVSTDELMRRLGYALNPRGVMVVGKVTPDAKVSTVAQRKGEIFNVADAPPGAVALIAEGLVGYDQAVFVYSPAAPGKPVPMTTFGQLCVVEADDHLNPYLGTLVKSGKSKIALELFGIGSKIEVEEVHVAAPVNSIHFP